MRNLLIAGNWKMNHTPMQSRSFFTDLSKLTSSVGTQHEVLVCVPFLSIEASMDATRKVQGVQIGAQNLHFENDGAYTGEISASMLREVGVRYVILGHSERREYFGETDTIINKKVVKALENNLSPILCVGEVLAQRKSGEQNQVVRTQLVGALSDIDAASMANIVIAYEPVWAIGTGETASPQQAQDMHAYIRSVVSDLYSTEVADKVKILYGGSMKPDNAAELLSQPDVDGGLIGGASLKADSFNAIIEIANELKK